jgi:hypothetical protein
VERRDADQGGDARAASRAQLWEVEHQRPGTHRPNPWDTPGQGLALAPNGTGPERRVQVVIQRRHVLIEPGKMGHEVGSQARRRVFEAVLLGRPHGDALPPPRQESPPFVGLRVRQRAQRGPHRLGKMGHGTGIKGIPFGALPGRFRNVPDLTGIDHHEGQGGRSQGRDHGPMGATRGFEHDERGLHGLEPTDKGSNPWRIVRDRPAFARRP